MPKPSSDPDRSFIRAQVPHAVHLKAKEIARYLNFTVAWTYNVVLSRELFDCDPAVYARQLFDDMEPEEREEPDDPQYQSARE